LSRSGKSGRLTSRLVPVASLTPAQVDAMWRIFDRYYSEVSLERFEADLRAKQKVILLLDGGDRSIQGFSSVELLEGAVSGRRFRALFSGDTILRARYWGSRCSPALLLDPDLGVAPRPGGALLLVPHQQGYKTYLLLARNFRDFWPRSGVELPAFEREVLEALAAASSGRPGSRSSGCSLPDVPGEAARRRGAGRRLRPR